MIKSNKTNRYIIKSKLKRKFYEIFETGVKLPKKFNAYSLTQAKEKAKKLLNKNKRLGRKVVIREIEEIYYEE